MFCSPEFPTGSKVSRKARTPCEAEPVLEPGELLRERYRIRKTLNRGGMGAVHLAEDTSLADGLCAVKEMLDLGAEMDQYVKGRFVAEMQVLTGLRHPGIPGIRDFFQLPQGWFLVMDYIQGSTLEEENEAHRAAKTTFSNAQAVSDTLVVLEVLRYLHSQTPQLLHRDIKPANLIREQTSGRLTVVDFGLARALQEKKNAVHTTVGTLGYSALEQLSGQPEVRSDLYSLGATLHEMVSGIRPTIAGVVPLTAQNMPNFDQSLSAIIARAAHQDIKQRYASAAEFRDALLGWQVCNSTDSETVRVVSAAPPSKRRFPRVALLLVLALLGGLVYFFMPKKPAIPGVDPGLKGNLFASRTDGATAVVGLGEDVGLFWVQEESPQKAAQRAKTVATRLNYLYHHQCIECGLYMLEPQAIRVGRYQRNGTNELVVFYAHMHDDHYVYGPEILVTVDEKLAKRLGVTPRSAGGYWRDLLRDVVALSRGEQSQRSPLGSAFQAVVADMRQKGSDASLPRLRAAVASLSSKQASLLQNAFRRVPEEFKFEADQFPDQNGFTPLAN